MNTAALSLYTRFALLAPAWLPIMAASRVLSLDDPTCRQSGHTLRSLARAIAGDRGVWDLAIEGTPPPELGRQPCVVVANHASLADPFLLAHLPFDLRFVAKQELFDVPLVGWLLRLAGDLPVHRGDHASAVRMTAAAEDTIRNGLSVMIFPEGTRSRTGELGAFRDGAFRIAIETGARVLPVALHGTASCVGPDGPQRARARAQILPPLDTTGLRVTDIGTLRDATRDRIASALVRRGPTRTVPSYLLDCPVEVDG